MKRSFGKFTDGRAEPGTFLSHLTPRKILFGLAAVFYLYMCTGFYPKYEAGLVVSAFVFVLSLLSVFLLEHKSNTLSVKALSFAYAAAFLLFLSAANLTGGARSPLISAALVPVLYMAAKGKYRASAGGAVLLLLSFLHDPAGLNVSDYAVFSALAGLPVLLYFSRKKTSPPAHQGDAGTAGDTGKTTRDFEATIYSLVTNLLQVHMHFLKPVSILFFVREAGEEGSFTLMMSVSKKQESIDKNYRVYAGAGMLGTALKKGSFFMFEVKGVNMPYYRAKADSKTAAVMPVILNKMAGFIAADFEEEITDPARAEGVKAAMTSLAEELGNIIEISDISAKAVSEERKISRIYDIYGKLNLLEGKSGLISAFFREIQKLGIASGYIAELMPDGAFEITESFNYANNVKGARFTAKEDDVLRYITETGKMAVIDNAQDKNIKLHFKRQDRDKFVAAMLHDREQVFGFVKLDKEPGEAFLNYELKTLEIILSRVSALLENAKLYEKIKDQAYHDGLTGLLNHLTFQERLRESREKRDKGMLQCVSLALMDIDFFKKFNDSFGHQEGDRVLKEVSKMLTKITGENPGTFCARYGGEEFVVVMEDYDLNRAIKLADAIREYSEKNLKGGNEKEKRVITLSIGVTSYPEFARDQREMIKHADEALYLAKEDGRNRVKSVADVRKVDRRAK